MHLSKGALQGICAVAWTRWRAARFASVSLTWQQTRSQREEQEWCPAFRWLKNQTGTTCCLICLCWCMISFVMGNNKNEYGLISEYTLGCVKRLRTNGLLKRRLFQLLTVSHIWNGILEYDKTCWIHQNMIILGELHLFYQNVSLSRGV